jgi:hypothetical protein
VVISEENKSSFKSKARDYVPPRPGRDNCIPEDSSRLECILSVITQNHWVCGLCPTAGILKTRRHNVSEKWSVSILKREENNTDPAGSLSHCTEVSIVRVSLLSPVDGSMSCFPNVVFCSYLQCRTMYEVPELNGSKCNAQRSEQFGLYATSCHLWIRSG